MLWQPALFGLACVGTIACTLRTRSPSGSLLAWLMVSVWAGANLLWLTDNTEYMPLLTLPAAVSGYAFWFDERCRWQAWFTAILAMRLVLHVVYPGSGAPGEIGYLHVLNATFFAALAAISWEGGADAIGNCLRGLHRLRNSMAKHSFAFSKAKLNRVE